MTKANEGGIPQQPAGPALLHLLCDVPEHLEPLLNEWWERFHHAELLTLDGFLSARRAALAAPRAAGRILTMYQLSEPAAADQPRGPDFVQMPAALDGNVVFNRRILRRVSAAAGQEPVGEWVVQLLREGVGTDPPREMAERVGRWPEALGVSVWRSATGGAPNERSEIRHLADTDMVLAECTALLDPQDVLARAAADAPGWTAAVYQQVFPAAGVLLPVGAG